MLILLNVLFELAKDSSDCLFWPQDLARSASLVSISNANPLSQAKSSGGSRS